MSLETDFDDIAMMFLNEMFISGLQRLMNDISEWSDKTFGEYQRNPVILYHLKKEVDELIELFESAGQISDNDDAMKWDNSVLYEYADCMMLLLDSAKHHGLSATKLLFITRMKLNLNKTRKWGKPDENGVVEHISDTKPDAEEKGGQL